jgi:hypothetical protein
LNEAIQMGVETGDWIVQLVGWMALVVDRGVLSAEAGRLALISCGQVAVLVAGTMRFGEGDGTWLEGLIGLVEQDDGSGVLDGVSVAGVVGLLARYDGLFAGYGVWFVRNDGSVAKNDVLDAGCGASGVRYGVLGVGFDVPGVKYSGSSEQFDGWGQPVGG